MKKMLALVVGLLVLFALAVTRPLGVSADAVATTAPKMPLVVHIKDFAFNPDPVKISAGEGIRFVNDDEVAHTATAADKSFDSGNIDQNKSFTHTFAKAGTYLFVCTYHPNMKGKIVVAAPSDDAK